MNENLVKFIETLEEIEPGSAVNFFNNCKAVGAVEEAILRLNLGKSHAHVVHNTFSWAMAEERSGYWPVIYQALLQRGGT